MKIFILTILTLALISCSNGDVNSLVLNETNKYLSIGDSLQIGYIKVESENKDYKVTWASSNDEIAFVDNKGLVVAKSEGQAVITATCRKESAICYINVVTYSFRNASIFDTNNSSRFHLLLSGNTSMSDDSTEQKNPFGVLLVLDIVLPDDSVNIVGGNYSVGNEGTFAPYFYSGQKETDLTGSFLIRKATNDTLPIVGGNFFVSLPDQSYFIRGNLTTEKENFSFMYEGGIPLKNTQMEEVENENRE